MSLEKTFDWELDDSQKVAPRRIKVIQFIGDKRQIITFSTEYAAVWQPGAGIVQFIDLVSGKRLTFVLGNIISIESEPIETQSFKITLTEEEQ